MIVECYTECACGCGRLMFQTSRKYATGACVQRAHRRKKKEQLAANLEAVKVDAKLLTRIIDEHVVLSDPEEKQLEREIDQAKLEIYRRRGGADRDFQLAKDRGEVVP